MGVKSYLHEVKLKVSPSRLFKAVITESPDVVPKYAPVPIKNIEIPGGGAIRDGCIVQTNFEDGTTMKYKMGTVDTENNTCKYTCIEGALLGDKFEKITYDVKFEASDDGGCVIKQKSEYYTKSDHVEFNDEEIEKQSVGVYKACEQYLTANPHVCA